MIPNKFVAAVLCIRDFLIVKWALILFDVIRKFVCFERSVLWLIVFTKAANINEVLGFLD